MQEISHDIFFSSRRRHTRCLSDWSSDVCSSDLPAGLTGSFKPLAERRVAAPSEMIAIGDSGAFVNPILVSSTNVDPSAFLYLSFPYVVASVNRPAVGDWHDGGANQVFCDG